MTKIKLYHYSNTDFKGYIDLKFFGANSYSNNSERLSGVKRSYFYLDRKSREIYLKGARYCYIAEIEPSRLYNLNTDSKGIVKRLKNSQDIHEVIKRRGYLGLIGSNGFPCVVLFKRIKINKRMTLTS
jgi:hypothetical protein